jgi:hypothetical protein
MTEQLHVSVSFSPAVGFISAASYEMPRSLTARSPDRLRRRIGVAFLLRWGKAGPVAVRLDLDAAAQAEAEWRAMSAR